jgi:membrane protease YdiL (CAAX protease family)
VVLLVVIAGTFYAYLLSIPARPAAALLAAFAIEAALYLLPGFEGARKSVERRLSRPALAGCLTASAALPYAVYAVPTGAFAWSSCAVLLALAAVVSFWYVVLPRHPAADIAFVALIAAALLGDVFKRLYGTPLPRVPLAILGQLMWTRVGILAALSVGGHEVRGFGFLPDRRDWAAGIRNFALFLPCGVLFGWALDFASLRVPSAAPWQLALIVAGTFLGMLWVVALREEFFFRGLLQEWLAGWTRSAPAGLLIASVLFGLVHLPFRDFPNWRFAILAAAAGLFYGRAYIQAGSVRAAMVTHALVNTAWRVFF